MKTILTGWNFWRAFRVLAGLYFAGFALYNNEWALAGIGSVYAVMALLNMGCAAGACNIPANVQNTKPAGSKQEVIFEEINSR